MKQTDSIYHKSTPSSTGTNQLQKSSFFQPKLTINHPGDQFEKEADAMADHVMRMPANDSGSFFKPLTNSISGLQCRESSIGHVETNESLEKYVGTRGLSGNPLSDSTRIFFEPRFGYDFSDVKIHNDSNAHESARNVNALAYTQGNNIVFGANQFSPGSESGKKLLAHELTHVIQQKNQPEQLQKKDSPTAGEKKESDYIFVDGYFPEMDSGPGISEESGQSQTLSEVIADTTRCVSADSFYLDLHFFHDTRNPSLLPATVYVSVEFRERGVIGTSFNLQASDPAPQIRLTDLAALYQPNFLTFFRFPITNEGVIKFTAGILPPNKGMIVYTDIITVKKCSREKACMEDSQGTGRWVVVPFNGSAIHPFMSSQPDDGPRYETLTIPGSGSYFICIGERKVAIDPSGYTEQPK